MISDYFNMDNDISRTIVHRLLEVKAIKFNFREPFIWTSGWKSPIYCDNRMSLSDNSIRTLTKDAYTQIIKEKFPEVEVIAGVATGAIAQGALVADKLGLPFVYVREKRKEHGLKKIIEGILEKGQKVVVVEDLVSTGGSSIRALEELIVAQANILGMVSAFSYDFPEAREKIMEKKCSLYTISSFFTIIDVAFKEGYITKEEVNDLIKWHHNPQEYIGLPDSL